MASGLSGETPGSTAGLRPLGLGRAEDPAKTEALPRPSAALLTLVGLALVVGLAAFAFWSWKVRLSAPYADDHDWLALASRQGPGLTVDYLLQPHNAQHIVWARLLAWLRLNGGGEDCFLAAGLALCLSSAAALVVFAARLAPDWRFGTILGGVGALVVTETLAVQDAAWAVFGVYVFVAAFAVLAFGAFQMRGGGVQGGLALAASLVFATASTCGNAAGLAAWPVLAWSAWRSGQRGVGLAVVILAGLAAAAFSLDGATLAQGAAHPSDGLGHLLKMAAYFGGYVTLPWAAGTPRAGLQALGWLMAPVGAGLLLAAPRGPERPAALPELGRMLIAFALITAVMATIGRVDELPEPIVPARYVVFADLLHVGLLFACAPWIARIWSRRPRLAEATIVLACALMLLQQGVIGRKMVKAADRLRAASEAFDRGDRSPGVVALVYPPDPDRAERIRRELRTH